MKIRVYGSSDDLIEIEEVDKADGWYAEFMVRYDDISDEPSYVGFSDGTLLRVSYDGFWHIVVLETGKCKISHRGATDIEEDYSDIVTLECVDGFAWVTCSPKMERFSGQLDIIVS